MAGKDTGSFETKMFSLDPEEKTFNYKQQQPPKATTIVAVAKYTFPMF